MSVSVPARTESRFANVAWPKALTIPHSQLDCADEVIEYQNVYVWRQKSRFQFRRILGGLAVVVAIINVRNDRTVIVRINDRGPYGRGRIIDLSHAAADELDMIRVGTTRVSVMRLRSHWGRGRLKDALNAVWEVGETPGHGMWHFMRSYVVSLAAVLALGFLLLVSLIVTAGLAAFGKYAAPQMQEWVLHLISILVSISVISLLFAMMFKWLPDAAIDWYDVWLGAIVTAALFEVGKSAIGFYIGKQGLDSTYGAAASIIVVLVWSIIHRRSS
jgi:Virulence factor BrkB/Lytic transglycolase